MAAHLLNASPPQVDLIGANEAGGFYGSGSVAQMLLNSRGDVNVLKPWVGEDGYSYINKMIGGELKAVRIGNATATLPKLVWITLDDEVQRAALPRMRFVNDLRARGLERTLPNGMATIFLQYQTRSGITPATISMDGLRESERDRPTFDLRTLPIPIIHKDFSFSLREVLASQNGPVQVDTDTAMEAAIVVAQEAEKLALGTSSSYSYGGATVYGLLSDPNRNTQVLTTPNGTNQHTTLTEVLSMIQKEENDGYYSPYMIYASSAWGQYLEDDYNVTYPTGESLADRILRDRRIEGLEYLDFLGTGFTLVLVSMQPTVIREIVGMEIQTIQWQSGDGLALNYKVMCILVPQVRADPSGNSGICHGAA